MLTLSMSKPWEKNWQILEPLNGGGQGDTFMVQNVDDPPARAVLKLLRNSRASDLKARARMHREVASLQTLATEGAKVPRFLDGNTDQYESPGVPLFFVMEHIQGRTLDSVMAADGPLPLQTGVLLALDICSTLRIAFKAGIAHRDIKPENLMVRSIEPPDIVLLDLGLSFNKEEAGKITETDETLDNKFLSLPERRSSYEDKRDFRSDWTSIPGVLLYVLTGSPPRNLRDSKGKTPNRTEGVVFSTVNDHRRMAYPHTFFDRGLNNDIDARFQTLDDLESRLREIIDPPAMIPKEDFQAAAKRHSEALHQVDRKNRHFRYRSELKGFQADLDKLMSELTRVEGFNIGWWPEHKCTEEAARLEIIWIFRVSVGVRAHERGRIIIYSIREEGSDCILSRGVAKGTYETPEPGIIEAGSEQVLLRYSPQNIPDSALLAEDIKASVLAAMEALVREIQDGQESSAGVSREQKLSIGDSNEGPERKKKKLADAMKLLRQRREDIEQQGAESYEKFFSDGDFVSRQLIDSAAEVVGSVFADDVAERFRNDARFPGAPKDSMHPRYDKIRMDLKQYEIRLEELINTLE